MDAIPHKAGDSAAVDNWAGALGFDEESQNRAQQRWQRVRCYGFTIGAYNLLAPLNLYCELLTELRIAPLPNSPDYFLGLTNVRGNLVPVYQLFVNQVPPKETSSYERRDVRPAVYRPVAVIHKRYALLMGNLHQAAALMIDKKPRPFDLKEFVSCDDGTQNLADLPEPLRSAVRHSYRLDEGLWYQIDHFSLFRQLAEPASHSDGSNN